VAKKSSKKAKKAARKKPAKKVARKKIAKKKTVKKAKAKTVKKTAKKAKAKTAKKTSKKAAKKAPAKKKTPSSKAALLAEKLAKKKSDKAAEEAPPVKIKSPLSRSELTKYKKLLIEKRRSIVGDMNGMKDEALSQSNGSDTSNPLSDIADLGSDSYETEFTLGLLENERRLLEEIYEALERIEEKTYGVCLGTGKPIRKARLMALPWCKYSIEYKKKIEERSVIPGFRGSM